MKATLILAGLLLYPQDSPTLEKIEREVTAVVEKARKSVVAVSVQTAGEAETITTKLAGIVFSEDGYVVTDGTALENAKEITVQLPDGRKLAGRLIAADRRTSVGVLKVAAQGLTPAELAEAKDVRQGLYAIAVGNPLGLKGTASVGFVSGLGRSILVAGRRYEDMLQMTTAVAPGDCGGFVANSRGQMLAMVHSSYQTEAADIESLGILKMFGKDTAGLLSAGSNAMSFATPAPVVKWVAERIIKHGRMVRGWAGITLRPVDDGTRAQLKIPAGQGVEVSSVDRAGPAGKAGLKRRDILLEWDGAAASEPKAIKKSVQDLEQEKRVRVVYLRGGARHEAEVTLVIEP